MNQLQNHIRITWDEALIVIDTQTIGQPPAHRELPWPLVEAWSTGQPAAQQPDGIYLLLKHAPYCAYFPTRAAGCVALAGELRSRGFPETIPAVVVAEAARRTSVTSLASSDPTP